MSCGGCSKGKWGGSSSGSSSGFGVNSGAPGAVRKMTGSASGFCTPVDVTCIHQADVWNGNRLCISQPGKYKLCSDIKFNTGVAICISASSVTIDFDGHTLDGQGTGCVGVAIVGESANHPVSNVTIEYGTIRNTLIEVINPEPLTCCHRSVEACAAIYMQFAVGVTIHDMHFCTFNSAVYGVDVNNVIIERVRAVGGNTVYDFPRAWRNITMRDATATEYRANGFRFTGPGQEMDNSNVSLEKVVAAARQTGPIDESQGIVVARATRIQMNDATVTGNRLFGLCADHVVNGVVERMTAISNGTGLALKATTCFLVKDSKFIDNNSATNNNFAGNGIHLETTDATNIVDVTTECSAKNGVNFFEGGANNVNTRVYIEHLTTKNNEGDGIKVPAVAVGDDQNTGYINQSTAYANSGTGINIGALNNVSAANNSAAQNGTNYSAAVPAVQAQGGVNPTLPGYNLIAEFTM